MKQLASGAGVGIGACVVGEPPIHFQASPLWNANIEVVQAERAWYVSHVGIIKGRTEVEINCMWAYPKTQNKKKSEGIGQLTIRI